MTRSEPPSGIGGDRAGSEVSADTSDDARTPPNTVGASERGGGGGAGTQGARCHDRGMDDVVGRTWQFVEVAGVPVPEGEPHRSRPALTFAGDGQVYGTGGVNRLRGTWSWEDGTLTFGPVVTTLMAGTPEHTARERAVLELLGLPLGARVDADVLVLTDPDGRVSRLLPAPPGESEV